MSGHIGLREEARAGHLLARRIARLFAPARGGGQVQRKALVEVANRTLCRSQGDA